MQAIDIVCNLFTPREVNEGRTGLDAAFLDQVRFPEALRNGVMIPDYLIRMDEANIERSLLIAVRAGDLRVRRIDHEVDRSRGPAPGLFCP